MLPVIFVHGYQFDPDIQGTHNPNTQLYPIWRDMLGEGAVCYQFSWYSVPPGYKNVLKAWKSGHWNTYRYAWALAENASYTLSSLIYDVGQCNILCHSLGSRVVLSAIRRVGMINKIKRVLILSGAEYSDTGSRIATKHPDIDFFNTVVPADDVLNRLAMFAPPLFKYGFLGSDGVDNPPTNWMDIHLDNREVQKWGVERKWQLRGDNPNSIGDHKFTYINKGNWGLWKSILNNEDLSDLKAL